MGQLHKRFTDTQVKELIERYLRREIPRKYIQEILGIGKARFFALVSTYREDPHGFSVQYTRTTSTRAIDKAIEENIFKELSITKELIKDKDTPVRSYNYSHIRDKLEAKYHQKVSLSTIIDRAKKNGFYLRYDNTETTERITPQELIARLSLHIPNPREPLTRYYSWYAHRTRGARRKRGLTTGETRSSTPAPRWKKGWAELLQLVFEISLACPRCGTEMKILSVITGSEPIEKILRHLREKGLDARAGPFAGSTS